MRKTSSSATFWFKRVFPLVWFGFIALFALTAVISGAASEKPLFLAAPVFMALIGAVIFKKLVLDLADEVHDAGDALIVRRGPIEERIPLSNIMNVSSSVATNPQRVVLKLISPNRFGDEVAFSPKSEFSFNVLGKCVVADELIERVHAAKHPGSAT